MQDFHVDVISPGAALRGGFLIFDPKGLHLHVKRIRGIVGRIIQLLRLGDIDLIVELSQFASLRPEFPRDLRTR